MKTDLEWDSRMFAFVLLIIVQLTFVLEGGNACIVLFSGFDVAPE